jgi:hypothetical protein
MIELKDFVAVSLMQIIDGIAEAQEHAKEKGARVNPSGVKQASSGNVIMDTRATMGHLIDFDIAVSASETGSVDSEGKVGISVVGARVEGAIEETMSQVSRIKFSVPVFFPEQK